MAASDTTTRATRTGRPTIRNVLIMTATAMVALTSLWWLAGIAPSNIVEPTPPAATADQYQFAPAAATPGSADWSSGALLLVFIATVAVVVFWRIMVRLLLAAVATVLAFSLIWLGAQLDTTATLAPTALAAAAISPAIASSAAITARAPARASTR